MKAVLSKDLNLLTLFTAIWEERNLSKAAHRLNLSQPAVSHALGRLREQMDDALFVRSSKGMTPTPYASELAPMILETLKSIENIYRNKADFNPAEAKETLSICIGDYFAAAFLQDFIAKMSKEAPQVKIVTVPDSEVFSYFDFEKGQIHLAITGFQMQPKEGFYQKKLVDDSISVCFRKKHSILKKEFSLKAYLDSEHMFISSIGSTSGLVDAKLKKMRKERNVSLVLPGFFEAADILANTDYVLTAPTGLCAYLAKKKKLQLEPTPFDMKPYPISMFWHERTQNDPLHQWVRNLISEKKV